MNITNETEFANREKVYLITHRSMNNVGQDNVN
jgi:hypothetical protein